MTRDSIPRDDLYGELEVSRQASVAAIEAAYRRLVKQHHPDVARSDDFERIKRLNLAREWLTDLDRRRRYDLSRGLSPTSAFRHHGSNGSSDAAAGWARGRPAPRAARSTPEDASEPARTFGVNANQVRIFLAGLRGLDSERARRVFDGRAVAHSKGYTGARRLAEQIGQAKRRTEWQLAREAASVIARGKLGDTVLTEQVVDVLADAAGAIAIRDLLSPADYKLLLLPWTWTSARVEEKAGAPGARAGTRKAASTGAAGATAGAVTGAASAADAARAATRRPEPAAERPRPTPVPPAMVPQADVPPGGAGSVDARPTAVSSIPVAPVFLAHSSVSIADLGASPWPTAVPEAVAIRPGWGSEPTPVQRLPAVQEPGASSAPVAAAAPADALAAQPAPSALVREPATARVMARAPSRPVPALSPAPPRARVPAWLAAGVGALAFGVTAAVLLGLGLSGPNQDIAAVTDAPTAGATQLVVVPLGSSTVDPTDPTATAGVDATPRPDPTNQAGGGPGPTPEPPSQPGPGRTPRPTQQVTPTPPGPTPTPSPTPAPTPTPVPPTPTPLPPGECDVPDLIGQRYVDAPGIWAGAGFTGPVTSSPQMQPNQRIGVQSLEAGTSAPCSSGITVGKVS